MQKVHVQLFDYLPTKYKASARDWQVRKFVWSFKDGKCAVSAAQLVAKKIREQFGTSASDMVLFVSQPAASGKMKSDTESFRKKWPDYRER